VIFQPALNPGGRYAARTGFDNLVLLGTAKMVDIIAQTVSAHGGFRHRCLPPSRGDHGQVLCSDRRVQPRNDRAGWFGMIILIAAIPVTNFMISIEVARVFATAPAAAWPDAMYV
jgi:hypothetical protein